MSTVSADEFDIIAQHFAPLARSAAARGLADDVAVLAAEGALVVTTDAIVEGVHFLPGDPIDTVAKKALRVNLSDLAAKGAKATGVLLTLVWPKARSAAEIAHFARGLGQDLALFDVPLLGGDTTSTDGPLMVTVTAFGAPLGARVPARADAKIGEDVWVTGEIGEAFLGLDYLLSREDDGRPAQHTDAVHRYRVPEPATAAAQMIADYASASCDVSDGLVADAGNIARASGVGITLNADTVPLSESGKAYVAMRGRDGLARLLTAGDDYQALFTASPAQRAMILSASSKASVTVSRIGSVGEGQGVRAIDAQGELPLSQSGHRHRLGR